MGTCTPAAVLPLIPCRDVSARQPPAHACKHREAGLRPVSSLGRYFLTMRTVLHLVSPYPPSLALYRMELPAGRSSHDFLPLRYIVGGASHPVISATAACPPRDLREYARCCPVWLKPPFQHIQSRDLVSRLTAISSAGGPSREPPRSASRVFTTYFPPDGSRGRSAARSG